MSGVLLEARGIIKDFPGTRALDQVSLTVKKGQIHGLLGENGAGKSTLAKILSGTQLPDGGSLSLAGKPVVIDSPQKAQTLGIAMVYQELSLVTELSVAENIFVGRLPKTRLGLVDRTELRQRTQTLLGQLKLPLSPDTLVGDISLAYQQMVEIAKAISLDCRLLILDEPTSSLAEREVQVLFSIIRELAMQGVSVLYISHKLSEIFALTDEITVLRDGGLVGSYRTADLSEDDVVRLMVGRSLSAMYPPKVAVEKARLLMISDLETHRVGPCSLELYTGEILGISGLVGAGRSELARAIFGADPWLRGKMLLNNKPVRFSSPLDAVRAGLGYLPEDRKLAGLFLDFSIQQNISSAKLASVSRGGLISRVRERALAESYLQQLNVHARGPAQLIRTLSGGNQQKVLLGKWLAIQPRLLIVDEPTRGIDVGAKSEIHALLRELTKRGVGIIMISSELPEILGMSDRILVMYGGRIVAELAREDASEELLLSYASGRGTSNSSQAVQGSVP